MSIQVTLNLPESVYHQAEQLAQLRCQDVAEILSETLTLLLPPGSLELNLPDDITQASDTDLLNLTQIELAPEQDQRLSALLDRQQATPLTTAEQSELNQLLERYQQGLLQKAQALNAGVQRGIIAPIE